MARTHSTASDRHSMTRHASLVALVAATTMAGSVVESQQAVFRARGDLVSVDVSVRNHNLPVPDLTAKDFTLTDNNVKQVIESVSLGAVPIDVTLFIDTSGTTAGDLDGLKA